MNSRFFLRVRCRRAATARKLAEVLSPDNRAIPSDQRFKMSVASGVLTLDVEAERAKSGYSTIRSILSDVELFREIWLISAERGG